MSTADVRERASAAREFHQVAQERLEPAPGGTSPEAQVAASNAVHAAIAASDALCGSAHGYHASGSDHRGAIGLLKAVRGEGPRLATRLARLLSSKTEFNYGGFCNRAEAERATTDAGALVDELNRLNL